MVYLTILFRMISVTALFLVVAILMGKRHIGELSVFDLIIALTLGSVAGADLADPKIPHGPTFLAIGGLGLIHIILSKTILKNEKIAHWISFDPTIVIQNGVIQKNNLAKIRYTVDELLSNLREKGIFDLKEVEYAILEPSGNLSVLKKSQYQPVTPDDMGIVTQYNGLSTPMILEGKIYYEGLKKADRTEEWLRNKLFELGYAEPEEVFIALLSTKGELYISPQHMPLPEERLDH